MTTTLLLCMMVAVARLIDDKLDLTVAPTLHWSFNHNHSDQQPNFGNELVSILRNAERREVTGSACQTTYCLLANFWSGYKSPPAKDTTIGSIEVTRQPDRSKNNTNYAVSTENTASGERSTYSFSTKSDFWHTLTGNWTIETHNQYGNRYQHYVASGSIKKRQHDCTRLVYLTVNGSKMALGTLGTDLPLTTPWALLDILPTIEKSCDIALLEDLERLRSPVRITPIESWHWPEPYSDLGVYAGWCVYGTGLPPTYYWQDDSNSVMIMSSLFQTWVLTRQIKGVDVNGKSSN